MYYHLPFIPFCPCSSGVNVIETVSVPEEAPVAENKGNKLLHVSLTTSN